MKSRFSYIRYIFFFMLCTAMLHAQKNDKSTSVVNAWSREIDEVSYASNGQYKHTSNMHFGDWKFKAEYVSPQKTIERKDVVNDRKNAPAGLNSLGDEEQLYYDTVRVEARSPSKKSFTVNFKYTAGAFEKDVTTGATMLIKKEHASDFGYYFYKRMDGFVSDPSGEKFPFHVMLYYSDSASQPMSYIETGKDTIILKPVFNSHIDNSKRFRVSGSSYEGFDCLMNGKLIGAAFWYQKMTGEYYKFWYQSGLDQKHQEAVASMMFVIVDFIN
jgi:hypothetical protein